MIETTLIIRHPDGLHARPAADFYRKTREFKSRITIQNLSRPDGPEVPVSLFNLLQIGAASGHRVRLRAVGEDEREAIRALAALIEQQGGER
ncbi:MAG: HPr family phosphocarrier protein [Chloroflexota bacterium]|nr:MAG: HPr family phosphocarrier protein [Chloroflexota bacterium]